MLFLTILNYFRQILIGLKYFVQSDWRIMVQNLELPYKLSPTEFRPGFKCDSCCSIFSFLCNFFLDHRLSFFSFFDWPLHCISITLLASTKKTFLICWHIHVPLYYPNYQIYLIVVYMPHYFFVVLFHSNAGKNVIYNFS